MKKVPLATMVLVLFTLLSVISVSARTTTVVQSEGRGANATWEDGTFALILANNKETLLGKVVIICAGPSVGFIMKELSPSELKWSIEKVRISTMISAGMLVIEWETVLPTIVTHTNEFVGPVHLIHNGALRWASATLMVIDLQGNVESILESGIGAVSEGVRAEVTLP